MSFFYGNTPEEDQGPSENYGHTLTLHATECFEQRPSEVYRYLGRPRAVAQALPELRVLRLINGETYFWKLQLEDFSLEGELRFTQKSEGNIVLWQTPEQSPTQVTGSMRFHAADEPDADSSSDELMNTRLSMTVHVRVPLALQERIGADTIERRLGSSLQEALRRVKLRLAEAAVTSGLRREEGAASCELPDTGKKDSPLR